MNSERDLPYNDLTPDLVLNAVERCGYCCDGRLLALNSYENRVYQVGIEDDTPLVAKFYRPGRWSNAAIQEEHAFALEIADQEIPVVPPLRNEHGNTLYDYQGFRYALYPRHGGHPPELDAPDHLQWLGRFIGRIHAVGAIKRFQHRPTLDIDTFGIEPYHYLLEHNIIPSELTLAYRTLVEDLIKQITLCDQRAGTVWHIRLHGDCHPGNILWTDAGPHFVDLDDCRMGPAVQDLWMLLSGDRDAMTVQLGHLLAGYRQFHAFNPLELQLIEPLRTLRMIHYAAWLAKRWHDPAFPKAFPWFDSPRYWEEHILALREQAALLNEPALTIECE